MAIYEAGEMYLENILTIKKRAGNVRAVDIVNEIGHAKSTVSVGLKSLSNKGYITIDSNGYISLTELGNQVATDIYNKHVILTDFLLALGVSKEVAENDACKIEHVISDETFNQIKKSQKNKHGNA